MHPNRIGLAALFAAIVVVEAAAAVEPAAVRFKTADDVEITADYYEPTGDTPAPVVILLHMYKSSRAAWTPLVPLLHKAGFAVLAIDLRGHGGSTKPDEKRLAQRVADRDPTLFNAMYQDVFAAYRFLAGKPRCDMSRVAVVGASVGCSVALDYARQDRSVDVVVCISPGEAYLGVDSRQHIAEIAKQGRRPILLLAAPGERKACDALAEIDKGATVFITQPGTQDGDRVHGTNMFGQVEGIENRVLGFIEANMGKPTEDPVVGDVHGNTYYPAGSEGASKIEKANRRLFSSAGEARRRGYKRGKPGDGGVRRKD
jgi:pimeloyl-ACP methyl ester carboxylesterase